MKSKHMVAIAWVAFYHPVHDTGGPGAPKIFFDPLCFVLSCLLKGEAEGHVGRCLSIRAPNLVKREGNYGLTIVNFTKGCPNRLFYPPIFYGVLLGGFKSIPDGRR